MAQFVSSLQGAPLTLFPRSRTRTNMRMSKREREIHYVHSASNAGLDSPGKTHGDDSLVPA